MMSKGNLDYNDYLITKKNKLKKFFENDKIILQLRIIYVKIWTKLKERRGFQWVYNVACD